MHSTAFLTLDDDKLIEYYWVKVTNQQRPILVFLHEGLGCAALWRDFPQQLAWATGCNALVYSRFGYGRSSPCELPRPTRYMHDEALDVLPRLLAALHIEDAILIGHSDGGSIALIYAGATGCHRVRAIITEAAHVFCEEVTVNAIRAIRHPYQEGNLREKLLKRHGANVDIAFWGWNDVWLSPDFRHWNIEEYLPKISVPLLVIQGNEDQYGTLAQVQSIANQVAGFVQVTMIPDCEHTPHRDQRELTLKTMQTFITEMITAYE